MVDGHSRSVPCLLMCRWQEEEEEHRQQMGSLRVAQERLEGRLRQQEEAKAIAEGEIARQKGCIGSMHAEASELECALHVALAEVPLTLVYFFKQPNHACLGLWGCCYPAVDAIRCKSLLVVLHSMSCCKHSFRRHATLSQRTDEWKGSVGLKTQLDLRDVAKTASECASQVWLCKHSPKSSSHNMLQETSDLMLCTHTHRRHLDHVHSGNELCNQVCPRRRLTHN